MPRVHCPYPLCRWSYWAWLERSAELAYEQHVAVCLHNPRKRGVDVISEPDLDVEETFGQYMLCRFRRSGCDWMARFELGQDAQAEKARVAHERSCQYRFVR